MLVLNWVAKDGQGEIYGGEYPNGVDREVAEAVFLAELLEQYGESEQRLAIKAGRMVWSCEHESSGNGAYCRFCGETLE